MITDEKISNKFLVVAMNNGQI
uniref:Uncharacterized protein n=1 Tax=Anguilla anguilla TaxID=7936 RepID=A0A0E9QBN5_ANGAN